MTAKRLDALTDRDHGRRITIGDHDGVLCGLIPVRDTVILALHVGDERVWTAPLAGDLVATITKEEPRGT